MVHGLKITRALGSHSGFSGVLGGTECIDFGVETFFCLGRKRFGVHEIAVLLNILGKSRRIAQRGFLSSFYFIYVCGLCQGFLFLHLVEAEVMLKEKIGSMHYGGAPLDLAFAVGVTLVPTNLIEL